MALSIAHQQQIVSDHLEGMVKERGDGMNEEDVAELWDLNMSMDLVDFAVEQDEHASEQMGDCSAEIDG